MAIRGPKIQQRSLRKGNKRRRSSARAAPKARAPGRQRQSGAKVGPAWGTTKNGRWKYIHSMRRVEHRCRKCGKAKYAFAVQCVKFWRMTPSGPLIRSKINRGAYSEPLPLNDPCVCLGKAGRLTRRLLRLMAEGKVTEEQILKNSAVMESGHA